MRALYKIALFKIITFTFVTIMILSCDERIEPGLPAPVVVVSPVVVTPPIVTPTPTVPATPIINEPIPANGIFTTRIILEDHTGTWCGHCPRLAKRMEDAITKYPNIIGIAIHDGDKMESIYNQDLMKINSITGFPTGVINRAAKWNENLYEFPVHLDYKRTIGIGIQSTVDGNTISGKVRVHNGKEYSASYKLNIILVEDNLIYDQVNYGYNNEANPIVGKVHNDVLRLYATKVLGDDIPTTNKSTGNVYEQSFNFNAKGFEIKNCKIIAYISESNVGIINANKVIAGKTQIAD